MKKVIVINWLRKNYTLVILPLFYLLLVLFISPFKEFPLNDDWAYIWSVKYLLNTGELRISDWASPTLVFQILWGTVWCKFFGFSYGILRFSTLVFSFSGALFLYLILKKLEFNEFRAFWGTFILVLNPLYLLMSYTFMTEVPYLCLALGAGYYYLVGVKENKDKYLLIGSFVSGLAFLTRQLGIFIPIGILLFLMLKKQFNLRKCVFIFLLPLVTLIIYLYWFNIIHHSNWANQNYVVSSTFEHIKNIDIFLKDSYTRFLGTLIYLGLFLSPIFLSISLNFFKKTYKWGIKFSLQSTIWILMIFLLIFCITKGLLPYFENTINTSGLGTITLSDVSQKNTGFFGQNWFWVVSEIISLLCIPLIFISIVKRTKIGLIDVIIIPWVLQFLAYFLGTKFFDRYILVLVPVFIVLMINLSREYKISVASSLFGLCWITVISLFGTQDYLVWNDAKWKAGYQAINQGIPAEQIANGFDWNGTFSYEKNMEQLKKIKLLTQIGEWEWQSLNNYRALGSFAKTNSSLVPIVEQEYSSWLSTKKGYVYILTHYCPTEYSSKIN